MVWMVVGTTSSQPPTFRCATANYSIGRQKFLILFILTIKYKPVRTPWILI
jgi:hypothetical protein